MILKLYEYIKNEKNTLYLVNKLSNEILSQFPHIYTTKSTLVSKSYFLIRFHGAFPKDTTLITKIIKKYEKIFEKEELLLTYEEKSSSDGSRLVYSYYIYIKSDKIERVIPPRYVYHTSSVKYRDSIQLNGLIPKVGDWNSELLYKPSIFASIDKKQLFIPYNKDVWRIDTSKITNMWYLDLNLNKYHSFNTNKYIMTYEPIPKEAVSLFIEG
jgi:hypothetical protein